VSAAWRGEGDWSRTGGGTRSTGRVRWPAGAANRIFLQSYDASEEASALRLKGRLIRFRYMPKERAMWVVRIDLELLRCRLSAADAAGYTPGRVRQFLARSGFRSLDGCWLVEESRLGQVESDEVVDVLLPGGGAWEESLDWQENHGRGPNGNATAFWLTTIVASVAVIGALLCIWLRLRR
jgi:hypothetical protein